MEASSGQTQLVELFKKMEEGLTDEQIIENTEKWTQMMNDADTRNEWAALEDSMFD